MSIQDMFRPTELPHYRLFFILIASIYFSTLFIPYHGLYYQHKFLQRLKYRDIIRPTELVVDSYKNLGTTTPFYIVEGYIDSVSVSLKVESSDLRDSVSVSLDVRMAEEPIAKGSRYKKIPVWYNPVNADIFHRRPKDNGSKFSISIWSWYYFKWFVFAILPHLFLSRTLYRKYKEYKKIKNELKTKK